MSQMGQSHLVIVFTVGPDDVAEGDRIFASHGEFMKGHPARAMRRCWTTASAEGPELTNPMDPSS